ncbi:DNAJC7 [Mytilus coruscus]|uniref:DNAJC7 n=1 Tax=Mytilus coruscus TaxID=42192 RepID=A0A6J8E2L8_MYTCO|nr:DNAJC7 [Mytilus coruscus]
MHVNNLCTLLTKFFPDCRNGLTEKKKSKRKDTDIEILEVDKSQDEDAIICKYLIALDEAREGNFWTLKENKQPYRYMCESYRKSRKFDVNPMSTRDNKYGAYVTFAFQQSSLLKICVIRKQLRHSGHDPQNDEERRMNRIDPLVVALIEELSAQGKNTYEIIKCIQKRND